MNTNTEEQEAISLSCDYLVIGAGTSNLSFVDTLLDSLPEVTFIIVDRFNRPGGHWTKAYPFVRLHQPSCSYGVNSVKLAKNRTKWGVERFDTADVATGEEICEYYVKVAENFEATKRVKIMFNTEYTRRDDIHQLTSTDGKRYVVSCTKTVQTETKVIVPSMRDVPFPTDKCVEVVPLNSLPEKLSMESPRTKYVVIGVGKSGVDAVIYLLSKGINPDEITLIASRDVWYFLRDGIFPNAVPGGKFHKNAVTAFFNPMLKSSSIDEIFLELEKSGSFGRIDPSGPAPKVFKGPMIDKSELESLRKLKNIVRMGRVTSITRDEIILDRGVIPFSSDSTLVVDCMADNAFGYNSFGKDFEVFNSDRIRLGPLVITFNPSFSAALYAFLESEFSNDEVKNSFLYFPRVDGIMDTRKHFLLNSYCRMKTMGTIGKKFKAGMKFMMKSRTNTESPMHHNGILPLLWSLFGPLKLKKKVEGYMKKLEEGKYEGIDSSDIPTRKDLDPEVIKQALRPR